MSSAISIGVLLLLIASWGVGNVIRSKRIVALRAQRTKVRNDLTEFARSATNENSICDIVSLAAEVASNSFGAHRVVLLLEDDMGWVASQPVGPPPPPLPPGLAGLFGWFKHNPSISAESELSRGRFGAMRTPLRMLMDTYTVDIVMPLVHHGKIFAVVGMAVDRKPTPLDRELLRIFRLEVTAACANVRLHIEASHLFSLTEEVDMANSIELAMVPEALSGNAGAFQWSGYFKAAVTGGSDFLGIYPIAYSKVMVVIGDAVGYELAGTMVSAVVKSCCDEAVRLAPESLDPASLLNMLNSSLYRSSRPALASCLAVLFDSATMRVSYANAGHLRPYKLSHDGAGGGEVATKVGSLSASGPLLGDLGSPEFKLKTTELDKTGAFVLLSDGLLAPTGTEGSEFGYRRLHRLLKKQPDASPDVLRDSILGFPRTPVWDEARPYLFQTIRPCSSSSARSTACVLGCAHG
ncbi:MAG: serine/threonine-protein phosphatase [Myxococcales bacterium]|nr:serine/threonine-protein phosphatase [Myxococcales bacterium]